MLVNNRKAGQAIEDLMEQKRRDIRTLEVELRDLYKDWVNARIAPFKIGDKIKCSISGKEIVGILDIDRNEPTLWVDLYIRPFKKDGSLSLNHKYIYESAYDTIEKVD